MRLLTQKHTRAHTDTDTCTHTRLQTLFAEAMCWAGDRGLAVGRQTADTVLWHQTFQFRISLSCLLTLSLSCTRAKTCTLGAHACTRKHINAHFLWSHCQNSKTLKVWHSRASTYTPAYSQALKSEYNFISHCWNALCEMRKHVSSVIWKWFQIFIFPVKTPVKHRDLSTNTSRTYAFAIATREQCTQCRILLNPSAAWCTYTKASHWESHAQAVIMFKRPVAKTNKHENENSFPTSKKLP